VTAGTETATIVTLDSRIDAEARSSTGRQGSRPAGDWLPPAEAMFRRADRTRRGADGLLRVEYTDDAMDYLAVIGRAADDWLVRLDFKLDDNGPRIAAIELRPSSTATDPRVGSAYLRRMGLGAVLESVDDLLLVDYQISKLAGGKWRRRVPRPGRGGRPDGYYAEWAAVYVAALEESPSAPIKLIVERKAAEGEYVTEAQVKACLNRARVRGLLTRVPSGQRSGGCLTKAGRALLEGR
jgi:hypothetical protein